MTINNSAEGTLSIIYYLLSLICVPRYSSLSGRRGRRPLPILSIISYLSSIISFLPSPTSYGSPGTSTPTFFQVLQGTCTPCKAEVRRRSGSFLLFFRRILRRCPEWHTLPLCHGIRLWLCIQVFRLPTFHAS